LKEQETTAHVGRGLQIHPGEKCDTKKGQGETRRHHQTQHKKRRTPRRVTIPNRTRQAERPKSPLGEAIGWALARDVKRGKKNALEELSRTTEEESTQTVHSTAKTYIIPQGQDRYITFGKQGRKGLFWVLNGGWEWEKKG